MNDEFYKEKTPCKELADFVDSFWVHKNPLDKTQVITIVASSFVKLVFLVKDKKIISYILTGLWTQPKEVHVPPNTTVYGCRMKILAPEFLLRQEVASIINIMQHQSLSFLNIENFELTDFPAVTEQWEAELLKIKSPKNIPENKLQLSNLLYTTKGNTSTTEIAKQIFWTNRQINRYLNKYIGIPLKKYLNIQKSNKAFLNILEGKFSSYNSYFDQSHFIREVKKYTGETPKRIFDQKNDRFIQLNNISNK